MSDKITVGELLGKLELIVNDSHGVDGWHLNGDIATWDELEVPSILQAIRSHLEKQTVDIKRLAHLLFISIPPGALTCPYDFLTKRFESRLRTELGVRIEPPCQM